MSEEEEGRLRQKIAQLQKQWDLRHEKLSQLKCQKIVATDADKI